MRANGLGADFAQGNGGIVRGLLFIVLAGIALLFPRIATAQTDASLLANPWDTTSRFELHGDTEFENASHLTDLPADIRLSIANSFGRVRLDPPGSPIAIFQLGYAAKFIDIQSHTAPLPNLLTDVSVAGTSGIAKIGEGGILAKIGVGYAGDKPFGDGRAYYGLGTVIFAEPLGHNDNLILGLDYDGHRTYYPDVPLPVIAYTRQVSDAFSFAIGVPFFGGELKPIEHLTISGRLILPDQITASVGYELFKNFSLFTAYNGERDGFVIEGVSAHHRLFFQQQRVEAGVRIGTFPFATLEGAVGYAFNQAFRTGFDYRNLDNLSDVGAAGYVRLNVELKF